MNEKSDETTYLKRLRFDPKLLNSFVAKYLSNIRLVLLLLFTIVVLGVYSYINLPRELNPDIKIPIVIIQTTLPGAGPDDIESLVTIPLEEGIQGVENIDTESSTSQDSVSIITVQFKSGVDPDKALSDVQTAVTSVSTLPTDAQTPKVTKVDFQATPVWQFTLSGTDVASLNNFSKNLQKDLKNLSSISDVTMSGLEDQEIQFLIKPEAVSEYKLNPTVLSAAIKTATSSYPAGAVRTSNSAFSFTIDPEVAQVDDLRNLKISVNNQIVSLKDIATVSERSKPDQDESYIASNSQPASRTINFNVLRNTAGDVSIDQAVADSQKLVKQEIATNGNHFTLNTVMDTSDQINTQVNELQRDFLLTIVLVFIILFVFLGFRQASVALIATPLTFFITFFVMKTTGISMSFISQFSLLLSLGLLVDDTIVVISAMSAYYRTGKFTPLQTGLLVWRDFFTPILTTTITTVWAFIPLLLSTGIIGEFIKPIPIVVSTTLIGSFMVAMLLTLPILIILLQGSIPRRVNILLKVVLLLIVVGMFSLLVFKNKLVLLEILAFLGVLFVLYQTRDIFINLIKDKIKPKSKSSKATVDRNYIDHGVISFSRIDNAYKGLIGKILISPKGRRNTLIMVALFSIFSYLLVPLGFVQNEFFPKTDENWVYVSVELPPGTDLSVTKAETTKLLNQLRHTEQTKFVLAETSQAFSSGFGAPSAGSNDILFTLALTDSKSRNIPSFQIAQDLRDKYANYQTGNLQVDEASDGPPAGADLQIELLGDDLGVLNQNAEKIESYLKTQKGVVNVDQSIKSGTSKVSFVPDQTKLAQAGLTTDQVGLWLRTFASGFTGPTIRFSGDTDDTDTTIRLSSEEQRVEDIASLNIPNPSGTDIPITSVGSLILKTNPTQITREDGKRSLTVTASVLPGYTIPTLNAGLEKYADSLNLPDGYSWKTGGVNDQNQMSVQSILAAMQLSFLLIITTMVIQFNSFRKALIVMLVIPLSISGVFIIFAITHTPLSFPALIGILALFGIVVKNSILVVDKINNNIKTGMNFTEAIVDGAVSRLEAIALTSLATIMGLIPISLSDPLWRGLGGAIISGLTFSGTIMLFFIPVVYYYLFHPTKILKSPIRK